VKKRQIKELKKGALEDKINGAEIVSLEELILGFLEEFQGEASEEQFAGASYWDVINFFVRYLDKHDYNVFKSHQVESQESSKLSQDIQDRCKRFYLLNWRKRTRKYLPHAGTKEICFCCGATKLAGLSKHALKMRAKGKTRSELEADWVRANTEK